MMQKHVDGRKLSNGIYNNDVFEGSQQQLWTNQFQGKGTIARFGWGSSINDVTQFFIIFDTHTPIVRLLSNRPLLLSSQNPSPEDRDVNYGRPLGSNKKNHFAVKKMWNGTLPQNLSHHFVMKWKKLWTQQQKKLFKPSLLLHMRLLLRRCRNHTQL